VYRAYRAQAVAHQSRRPVIKATLQAGSKIRQSTPATRTATAPTATQAEQLRAEVSKQTITAITDRVMEGLADWQSRPLDPVYAVIFIDAINVKIREGQVANRPIYLALGVTVDGERDVLGLWAGEHGDGEGAKYWLRVLTEIKNRGVRDVCMLVCDGLKGLPDAVSAVWEKTIVQTCIVHLLRNSFKYASKRDWAQVAKDLKPVYTAASEAEALDRFAEFSGKWEKRYPAIIRVHSGVLKA
jgi:putative transposase